MFLYFNGERLVFIGRYDPRYAKKVSIHSIRVDLGIELPNENKKILHSVCISLSKLYEAGLKHMHIKPSNIISMGNDHYILSDLGEFSVAHEDNEYAAPEQTVVQQQSQFSKQKTESMEIDIFRLGLSMVEVATLRGIQELKVFRNPKLATSNIALNYKREIQNRYGQKFSLLLNNLIEVDSDRRVSLKDLLTKGLDDFMQVEQPHSIEINAQERAVNMILDDSLQRIRDRGQKPDIYFDQYEMDQLTQVIHTQAFFDALKNLGINLSNGEKQLVKVTLSHEGSLSELKLTQFLNVGSSGVLRMRELGALQDKSLRELMKEVQSFSNQNKVELLQQFMRKDPKSLNYLDTLTFADIMAQNKMELSSEDLRLVGDKYDPLDKGRIYYKFFIEDMQSSTIAAETDLKFLIFEMYQIIRNKFNTIDAFLNKLDPQSRGNVGIKDIGSFLYQYNIQPSTQVLEQLFKIIDPQGQQVAAYLRILIKIKGNLFTLPIDKEITEFLQSTANILLSTSSTLGQTLERESENSQINVEKLFELFKSMGLKLKRPDLTFYLVTLRIQRPQDNIVNINEMREEFYKQAKRLGVLNLYVFKGPTDDEEHKPLEPNGVYQGFLEKLKYKLNFLNNQEVFSLFEVSLKKDSFVDFNGFCQKIDEIDGTIEIIEKRNVYARLDPNNENRVSMKNFLEILGILIDAQQIQLTQMEDKIQGFEPDTFNSMKEIISAINKGVEKLGVTVGQYFTPKKSKLDQTDYRYLLKQIDIYVTDYSDYEKFALAISYTSDQNQIDIDKLLRILTYQSKRQKLEQLTKVSQNHISPARTVVLWFEQVVQRMVLNKLDFYIFQDFDIYQYGFISRKHFEQALSNELSIETDQSFELFVNYLKDDRSGDISLRKLKEGIEKERDSRLVYEDLVDLVKEQRMDIDRIFRNYDFNSSQSMDIREFERLIRTLQPTISSAVIEVLFIKFDDNNDQSISLKEFRTRIIGQQQGVGPSAHKNLIIQQFIEDLEILLHNKGTTFEDVFKPYEHQGTIKIDDFKDAIKILGFPMKEEKTKVLFSNTFLQAKNNHRHRLNMKLLREQFHRFKKISDNGEFMLGEDDVKRVENFANLIERKLQRVNKSYEEVFVQRAKIKDGNFSFEDVKNIVLFNLHMEDSVDQKMFFRYIQNTGGQNLVSNEQLEKLILSKKGISQELTNKVIEFLNKNPQIMNEFESIDQSQQGFISPIEFRRAFRKLGGPTLEPEEIRIIGDKFKAIRNGQIIYKKLISQAKLNGDNGLLQIDKLQSELRESLSQRKVNLVEMMQDYDRGNGKVKVVALLQELKHINITITTAQQELLFAVIPPDETNSVDLQELAQFIEKGSRRGESLGDHGRGYQNSKLTKFQDRHQSSNFIKKVKDSIQHYLEEKSLSAGALFLKLEKNDSNFLSFAEFKKALERTFGVVATEQEYEAVFESFNVSKSYHLSMEEFESAVLGEEAYQRYYAGNQILLQEQKKNQLAVSYDMKNLYKKIRRLCLKSRFDLEMLLQSKDERNTGQISQYSFKKLMRPFTPHVTEQELDFIFESFDHNQTKIINYNDFISKVQEIDIDIQQIIIQIQESMKGYNINEQQLFNSFDQNHDGLFTLKEFDSMLQSLAILLPEEEVWECFQCFDFEGAGEISLTQFTKVMSGQKPSNNVSIHNILMKNQNNRKQSNPQGNTQEIKILPKQNKKTVNFERINQIEVGEIFKEIEPKIPASHLIMTQLQVDNVVRLVTQFVQKRERTMQDLLQFYFPSNDRIDEQTFVLQTLKLECGLNEKAARDLFYYLDSYVTGLVGVDQFKRMFMPQQQEQEQKVVKQPKQPTLKPAQVVPEPKQKKQMLTGQHQLDSLVVAVKAFVVRKKRTVDDLVQFFYPPGGASQLDEKAFLKLATRLQLDLREQQVLELFYHLDINGSGLVSMNEFCLVFAPESRVSDKVEKKLMNSLDDEIATLFDMVDENKNGHIEQKELRNAFLQIGLNASNEDLAQYFSVFDKDHDDQISKEEFITIMREFVRKELGSVNDLIVDLRREFKNADVTNSRSLRPNQIKNVFKNLGIAVPEDDIGTLFKEVDYDKSGKIDIDELIHFMTMNQSGMTARAAQVVMNIKGSQRISLKDLKVMFDQMPQNFTSSFCRTNNKKGQNLPSSSFKHKLDQSGLFYTDIIYVKNAETQNNQSVLEKVNIPQIAIEIQFIGAEGIPKTDDKDLPRESYVSREIAVVLYDRVKAVYLGNVVYLSAQWQKEYEDRWSFDQSADKSTIIFNQAKFDERRDDHIDLIVEMIAYIKKSNKVIEVNCCHAQIPLTNLVKLSGKMKSELRGGAPNKVLVIDKKDVRANHEGWRRVMQTFSSSVQSSLNYEVRKISNTETLKGLTTLPEKVIIPLFALNYIECFREYFAFKSLASGDLNILLPQNPELKSLLTIIDCHIVYERVMIFWNTVLKPKITSFQIMINALQALGNGLFLLLNAQEFKFDKSNPTKRTFDANENKKKIELLDHVLNDMLSTFVSNKSNQKKALYPFNYEPIYINELMDDDEEAENNQFDRIANRKSKKIK